MLIKVSYINVMIDAVIVSKRMRLIERQSIYGEVGVEITFEQGLYVPELKLGRNEGPAQ